MSPTRVAALVLMALCAGAAWLDAHSPAAGALREKRPVWGLAALREQGRPDVVAPALYLLYHDPRRKTLDVVSLPPGVPAGPGKRTLADAYAEALPGGADAAARAMENAAAEALRAVPGWPADASGPLFSVVVPTPASARPGSPGRTRARLAAAAADPFLWLKARPTWEGAVLTRALRAVPPEGLRAARWPAPELAPAFAAYLAEGRATADKRGVVTVEVLNAGGPPGVALKATKVLRWAGFDVVHFGNAAAPEAATSATDRVGHPEAARRALSALGCPRAESLTALEPSPLTMASVTVGGDFASCARLRSDAGEGD
ncbi:LytR family transcriptional regulator [bacterium]|nr:MAG: LytR family transcriptional regulator [bacterium]